MLIRSLLASLLGIAAGSALDWIPAAEQELSIAGMARVASTIGSAQASAQLPMRLAELVSASPVVLVALPKVEHGSATSITVVEVLGRTHPAMENGARPDLPAGLVLPCTFSIDPGADGRRTILFGAVVAPDGEARFQISELPPDQDVPASPGWVSTWDGNALLLVRRLCLLREAGVGLRYPHELSIPAHAAFPLLKTAWDQRVLVSFLPLMDEAARRGAQAPRPFGLADVVLAARHAIERSDLDPWLAPVGVRILAGAGVYTSAEESLALVRWTVAAAGRAQTPRLRGMLSALTLHLCQCNASAPNAASLFDELESLSAILLAGTPSPMDLPVIQAAASMAGRYAAANRERIRANADLLARQVAERAAAKP